MSAVVRALRLTVEQRRVPPYIVDYVRQHVTQAWRAVRRRARQMRREPQRRAISRALSGVAGPQLDLVPAAGVWQAAFEFRFSAVREVAEDNLAVVSRLLDDADVPYFVRDASSPGSITIGVDVAERPRVWDALGHAEPALYLYACLGGRSQPVPLWRRRAARPHLTHADRVLVYRNHRVTDEYVIGTSHACIIEFWHPAGANLRAPAGARPGRVLPSAVTPARIVVGDRPYPTLSDFADHRSLVEPAVPVDIVYTWVDDRDDEWRRRFETALARNDGRLHPQAANASRYRSRDELRFSLRSVAMYAHFVRRVHIVTAGQVPDWLDVDHPDIRIVDHTDILEDAHLPTFNSHAIEARLHHIDGLAEHYVYFNDDFMLGRQVTSSTFFTPNGLAKIFTDELAPIPAGPPTLHDRPVDSASKNVRDLVRTHLGMHVARKMLHVPYPQRRSVLAEMEKRFPDEFERTASSRFRRPTDVNVASCFAAYYAFATGRAVPGDIVAEYINVGSRWAGLQMRRLLDRRDRDAFCINETDVAPDRVRAIDDAVGRFLQWYLPVPSPYELSAGDQVPYRKNDAMSVKP